MTEVHDTIILKTTITQSLVLAAGIALTWGPILSTAVVRNRQVGMDKKIVWREVGGNITHS